MCLMQDGSAFARCCNMHMPNGFHWRASTGSCHPGDGDSKMGIRVLDRALGHGTGNGLRNGAHVGDEITGYAQEVLLRAVRVDHETAIENVGRSRNFREARCNQSASAALCR